MKRRIKSRICTASSLSDILKFTVMRLDKFYNRWLNFLLLD